MKIIHTADLHIGQTIYQHYDRRDEHEHFFAQLARWCADERPDALLVSGDVFDIQQPSAAVRRAFTEAFVGLHRACPSMHLVITAGNHDSAARLQADSAVWTFANAHLRGTPPSADCLALPDGWQDDYIVELAAGFIIALPWMAGERTAVVQSILDRTERRNPAQKPVVLMAHAAIAGMDATGHGFDLGTLRTQPLEALGRGYDYAALGHIHRPQTLGHPADHDPDARYTYPAGVARYAGSALHVSCDEAYPHTVSLVEIDRHGGTVGLRQLRIDEWRHFHVLPTDGSAFSREKDALKAVARFADSEPRGYFRLRMDARTPLGPDFAQRVYELIAPRADEIRYNPKISWTDGPDAPADAADTLPVFAIAELQQMASPIAFVERTIDQYPGLSIDELRAAFAEAETEMRLLAEAETDRRTRRKTPAATSNENPSA